LAIISLTGHVWHPIGKPSGLARSFSAHPESKPTAAACAAAFLQNSLLEIADINASLPASAIKFFLAQADVHEIVSYHLLPSCRTAKIVTSHLITGFRQGNGFSRAEKRLKLRGFSP
jgi:hypothetical protein